ncbi:CBS domain-containing protein [Nannocystis exedens]|uniref:CBS domain-containing protein n=1 Tax=Nannocystis exedens TaxID=54 RepID=A0A1I2CCF2_9BACT|nr:CBS domain-containing protein [Nannocystis exedens]PCC68380.1 XRE family transcriptional regulator [Nannocystis exedens]SFE65934.1 CBS domain-containing protein [Nannocystis exedens]
MRRSQLTVGQFMTRNPSVIDGGLNLVDTYTRMFQLQVRHLPVYSQGHLVGIVSDRDIGHILAVQGLDPQHTTIESVCTPDPYVCDPDSPLAGVVADMSERKIGAAIVMRDGRLEGIFTVVDALEVLLVLLNDETRAAV